MVIGYSYSSKSWLGLDAEKAFIVKQCSLRVLTSTFNFYYLLMVIGYSYSSKLWLGLDGEKAFIVKQCSLLSANIYSYILLFGHGYRPQLTFSIFINPYEQT